MTGVVKYENEEGRVLTLTSTVNIKGHLKHLSWAR